MTSKFTYELKIEKPQSLATWTDKESLKVFLLDLGVESFVEGVIDDLDIDHAYENPQHDFYSELGGGVSPISIYSYDPEYLEDIKSKINQNFPTSALSVHSMASEVWMEGWKESFKPIFSEKLIVHPPWEKPIIEKEDTRQFIEIEPGMAFGTGQHATTQICLKVLENLPLTNRKILDVGTGTGVLAIGIEKLGAQLVHGTDIDVDAVRAAKENAEINGCAEMYIEQGTAILEGHPRFPECGYDLVVANILFVVLSKIIGDLSLAAKAGGQVLLSGVLKEQADSMISLAKAKQLELVDSSEQDGWVALLFHKLEQH